MATLEVHDGQGRVERVTVSRDHPAMFGSSPKCDIVLSGESILPFHGRIRWQAKKHKFKVDASPEAQYLIVNGTRMSSSSYRMGDEIEVGGNRLFLISEGDAFPSATAPPPRDDVTRVQPHPFRDPPPPATMRQRKPSRSGPARAAGFAPPSFEAALESVVADLESGPAVDTDEPPPKSGRATGPSKNRPPQRGWARLFFLFSPRATAPGQEQVLSSPLVFGLIASLAFLLITGAGLYAIIAATAASRLFNSAVQNLEDGDYRNAIRRFDEFVAAHPKDPRVGRAKVHRAMANVRQYTSSAGASWSLALEAERDMVDAVGQEKEYRDASTDLGDLILKTGENLADRARQTADPRVLTEAESAATLHARVAGQAADTLFRRSRMPAKLDAARAAVRKAAVRSKALAAMDAALKAGSSTDVYAARDALVADYADQADDRDLLARMIGANDLIRKAVSVDPSQRPAETAPRPEPLGPPTTLVLRASEPVGSTRADGGGAVAFALADGFAFGVDGATGAPLWQVPVGLDSTFPPQPVPGGTTALAFDARHDELVRLDSKTGKLVWRQATDEPMPSPPLVLGNQVIASTPSGKVRFLDLETGALTGTIDVGQPLSGTPVSDESGRVLYATAAKDCLFVLTRDPLGCASVLYLGHAAGSIACPPARLGRYLVVPENHTVNQGRWRVFVLDEDGTKPTAVQQVPVLGWTWDTPATSGSVIWATGDRGGVTVYAVGAYGEKEPFRMIARLNPDAKPSGPSYALSRSEREVWVGSARSGRYELDPESGALSASWTLSEAGPATAPPQVAGPLMVLSQQNPDGPGVGLWAVDPKGGAVRWRTVLGTPWPCPPTPTRDGSAVTTLGVDGATFRVSGDDLRRGGFVTSTIPRPGAFRLPPGPLDRLDGEGWTAIVPGRGSSRLLVRRGDAGPFLEVRLPAPTGARPVAWGRAILLPGSDGRVYLVDPLTGESQAEPFVPPFDREKPTRWRAASPLGLDAVALADEGGRVRRLVLVKDPRPRLVVDVEVALGKALGADPAAATSALVVVTADDRVRSLASRDLSPAGAWPLDAPLSQSPSAVEGRVFVTDEAGGVLAVGGDGGRLWSIKLPGGAGVTGSPAVRGEAVWLLTSDGTIHARSLSDGSEFARQPLGVLPAGGPISVGDKIAVPVGLSTLRLIETPDSKGAKGR